MRAHQIMTRQVLSVSPDTPVLEAANTMLQQHISGLPVVDKSGKLVGIVSEGDFIRRAEIGTGRKRGRWLSFLVGPGKSAVEFVHEQGRKVGEVMTPEPYTITEETLLEDIVQLMEKKNVKRLPVMRGDSIVGIVTRSNLSSGGCRPRPRRSGPDSRRRPYPQPRHRSHREERLASVWTDRRRGVTASCISAASLPTIARVRPRSSQRRMFPGSRRFTIIFAGSTLCPECM